MVEVDIFRYLKEILCDFLNTYPSINFFYMELILQGNSIFIT